MHRLIMKVTDSKILVDHINHEGLDNQKLNLRLASHSQNMANRKSKENSTSKFLGVHLIKKINKFEARIKINKISNLLGSFPNTEDGEIAAAKTYDEAARKQHGEFANLNFKN